MCEVLVAKLTGGKKHSLNIINATVHNLHPLPLLEEAPSRIDGHVAIRGVCRVMQWITVEMRLLTLRPSKCLNPTKGISLLFNKTILTTEWRLLSGAHHYLPYEWDLSWSLPTFYTITKISAMV